MPLPFTPAHAVLRDGASFTDHAAGMSRSFGRLSDRPMQFPTEMHLVPRGMLFRPGEEQRARAIPEIGSSADFLDKRDARSDARTFHVDSQG